MADRDPQFLTVVHKASKKMMELNDNFTWNPLRRGSQNCLAARLHIKEQFSGVTFAKGACLTMTVLNKNQSCLWKMTR